MFFQPNWLVKYQSNYQSLHNGWSRGDQGVPSNLTLRHSYFIFMENFQKNQQKLINCLVQLTNQTSLCKFEPPIKKSWIRTCFKDKDFKIAGSISERCGVFFISFKKKGFSLQETRNLHYSMNRPKLNLLFIFYIISQASIFHFHLNWLVFQIFRFRIAKMPNFHA